VAVRVRVLGVRVEVGVVGGWGDTRSYSRMYYL
jgi:hypothetical protein